MSSKIAPGSLWGEEGKYDSILMSIMTDCGKIQPFFEAIFSFLSRRTDFYIIMEHDRAEMGFAPGVALNMVIQAFKKYEILTRKREAELMREAETRRIDLMTDDLSENPNIDVPSSATEHLSKLAKLKVGPTTTQEVKKPLDAPVKTVQTTPSNPIVALPTKPPDSPPTKPANAPPTKPSDSPPTKSVDSPPTIPAINPPTKPTTDNPPMTPPDEAANSTMPPEIPPTNSAQPIGAAATKPELSEVYNGSKTDNYVWSQTMTDLDIKVSVPKGTTGKALNVAIKSDSLKVELLKPEKQVILNGRLLNRIKVKESLWSLDKTASAVLINLEKNKELMWKSVFEGEEGIDLTKVDTTRDISEFDEEAQAAIQKVTYDHHMKMLGKPTSNEKKAHDILRKAWDAPGSPFKGTPFDPSRVNIAGVW